MDNKLFSNKLIDETAPESIWLGVGDEGNYHEAHSQGDLYWCEDKIDANDVKYIRADLVLSEITLLTALVESYKVDAERYGWLKNNIDRFPDEYNAPYVRVSENYDYAMSTDIDKQIDDARKEKG